MSYSVFEKGGTIGMQRKGLSRFVETVDFTPDLDRDSLMGRTYFFNVYKMKTEFICERAWFSEFFKLRIDVTFMQINKTFYKSSEHTQKVLI